MEQRIVSWDYSKNESRQAYVQKATKEAKAKVCAELEKVCPTDKALARMVKEMHNIFDKLDEDITSAMYQ